MEEQFCDLRNEIKQFEKFIVQKVLDLNLPKLETLMFLSDLKILDYVHCRTPLVEFWYEDFKNILKQKYPKEVYFNIDNVASSENRHDNVNWIDELNMLFDKDEIEDDELITVLKYRSDTYSVSYGDILNLIYNKAINEGLIGYHNDW